MGLRLVVWCDGCGAVHDRGSPQEVGSARESAARDGWRYYAGTIRPLDLCPDCRVAYVLERFKRVQLDTEGVEV